MLDVSADNLSQERDAAIELRKRHTDVSRELIYHYAGEKYRSDWCPEDPIRENHGFEYISTVLPNLVYYNPKIAVSSRRPRIQRDLAMAMQHGGNRWISDVNLAEHLERVALDLMFDFGVMLFITEPLPGYDGEAIPPLRPGCKRISPRMFFTDPQTNGGSKPRFTGHAWIRDKEDLLKAKNADGSPKFDQEVVKTLCEEAGLEEFYSDPFNQIGDNLRVRRGQVIGYEIFVPEHGMVYTMASYTSRRSGKDYHGMLRKPRRAVVPSWGPYTLFGIYAVPDQVYPLSPLAVTHDQVQELNLFADQAARQASTSRRLVLVDAMNPKLVEAVKNFDDGGIASIPNFNRNGALEVNFGGAQPEVLDYIERLRIRLDRTSGLTDVMRGNVSGQATATENKIAAAAADIRIKFMQRQFRQNTTQVIRSALWAMFELEDVQFPVPRPQEEGATASGGMDADQMEDGIFIGGKKEGQEAWRFEDLEVEIEPYSMELVDETALQDRMTNAFNLVLQVTPMIRQFPEVNWRALMDDYFQSMNIPDAGRKYFNWGLVEQMLQMQLASSDPMDVPGVETGQSLKSMLPSKKPSEPSQKKGGGGGLEQSTGGQPDLALAGMAMAG
jgi:hypothetical protein